MSIPERKKVSFACGRYEDYDNSEYVPGRVYYLISDNGETYIYLDGESYTVDNAERILMKVGITVTAATGNYNPGDKIPVDTDLKTLLKNMLSQDVYPTYVLPSASFGSSGFGSSYEVGTVKTFSVAFSLTDGNYSVAGKYTNKSAGCGLTTEIITATYGGNTETIALTGASPSKSASVKVKFVDQDGDVGKVGDVIQCKALTLTATPAYSGASSTHTYIEDEETLYYVKDGVPYSFLNEACDGQEGRPDERILGGTLANKTLTAGTPYRAYFSGYAQDLTDDFSNLTAADIASLDTGNRNKDVPTSITVPLKTVGSAQQGMQQLFVAVPTGSSQYNKIPSIKSTTTNLPQTVHGPYTRQIGGANNYHPVDYKVWYVKNTTASTESESYSISWS